MKSYIKSCGGYLPEKILTNHDLSKFMDTTHEWIVQRTGIEQRHIAAENELTSDMAEKAAKKALANAGMSVNEIDLILVATTTPDLTFPSTAVRLQQKLACTNNCPAFDLQAVCSGFVYGLEIASKLIFSGAYKNILLVAAEKMSSVVDWQDRSTSVLFGDGAGAVVISANSDPENSGEIFQSKLQSDGSLGEILNTDGGVAFNGKSGHLRMKGTEVFKHAVNRLSEVSMQTLEINGFSAKDVDLVIPHQANTRIINAVVEKLAIEQEKVIKTVSFHANTSAASIPLALNHAFETGQIKRGQLVLIEAFGAGLCWGGSLFRF